MDPSNVPYALEEDSAKPKRIPFELTPRRHELLCTYLLGLGTLFLYTGYAVQQFIGESVIHSIHSKSPDTISAYAGYYGAAAHLSAFALCTLITPSPPALCPIEMVPDTGFSSFCPLLTGVISPQQVLLLRNSSSYGSWICYCIRLAQKFGLHAEYIIRIYAVAMGLGEAIGGIFLRPLIKRAGDNGLYVAIRANLLSYSAIIALGALSIPNLATFGPTTTAPLFFTPCRLLVFTVGFLIGFSDFCVTMCRAVICQVAVPDCRMQVFSLSKLYQSGSSVVVLLLTPYMTIYTWLIVLTVFLVIGTTGFVNVARRTAEDRQKVVQTIEVSE